MPENEILSPAGIAAKFVNQTDRHIFLTGKAGTGKTTFLRSIINQTHKKAVIAAPTGIAAINASGVTIHSLFQLPFGMFLPQAPESSFAENLQYNTPRTIARHFNMNAAKRRLLTGLELLIIDEVSMMRADLLDAIDTVLKAVRKNPSESFGGVQVLFIGDLHQLPPVVKNNEWQVLSQFYKSVYFFDALVLQASPPVYIELDKIYRQSDEIFINLLNNLRNSTMGEADIALLKKYYQKDFKPALADKYITLTTHNSKADAINRGLLDELKAPSYFFTASIADDFPENAYPGEKTLELKVGAQVMFTKNDPTGEQRFFNGKIAEVTGLADDAIEVKVDGIPISVERYTWENIKYSTDKVTNEIREELAGTFIQYPVKLAWAITVHKSQGLTFDRAIIDIGDAFAAGQVYVALSRLRSLEGLVLTSLVNRNGIRPDLNITSFGEKRQSAELLNSRINEDRDAFLRKYLKQCFDLREIDQEVYEHSITYTMDERRSAKQKHHPWAIELQQKLTGLKKESDKFLNQLDRLFFAKDFQRLLLRLEDAGKYFKPALTVFSEMVFEQIETVKQEKSSNTYHKELLELEALFFEQRKKITKARAFLEAVLNGKEFARKELLELLETEGREEQISKARLGSGSARHEGPGPRTGKTRIKKKKEDTKEVTFKLFKEGKTLLEIAKERSMTPGTIEGHLAYFIARKELSADQVIDKQKIIAIAAAVGAQKTTSLSDLWDFLGREYSFGEIKIGLAAHLAED